MITDAIPALLSIRATAALVLHHAGYLPDQIAAHLGQTATPADPSAFTPDLLTAAGQYLRDSGFTYWGIAEAVAKLGADLVPQASTGPDPEPEHQAWDDGFLFDLATA